MSSYIFVVTSEISLYSFLHYLVWLSAIQTFVGSKGMKKKVALRF